ncbi:unnamed protein product [Rotaria sp. Silwood1]|nr:unnamed protein product [Rotaria sp. Silwood1]CAF1644981.1 unnamed protein product [Rotaria sp. Silwood1]CAF3861676.1 unnamed protein product [Rotaria sp. Silwood1]CAF3881444.1 unnamed protein product [Rotaria sp. Silwood1]CAF4996433.1 unnamed protein product [Rotaria sp. Silwood1]
MSWSLNDSHSIEDRFLTNDTQIQLKILCREPSANVNQTQGQIKKNLNKEYGKTKIQIYGRIGRVVGCLPLQAATPLATNQLPLVDNKDLQKLLLQYYNELLWKRMEQRIFKTQQVNCDYSGELYFDEYSNIRGPEISSEQASKLIEQFVKQEREQMTANQQNNIHRRRAADQTIIKSNDEQFPLTYILRKQTVNRLRTWNDGFYIIELFRRNFIDLNAPELDVDVIVTMKNRHGGYITADEYPTLVFYGVMCGIYALFATLWFIWCAFYWGELLIIQFWVGGFILIGMIEQSAFFVEYDTFNRHGYKVHFAFVTAEVLSCLRRTVLRMLFIIVAFGYDIVKPHLGPLKQKVLTMGILYFAIAITEAMLRLHTKNYETNHKVIISFIALVVADVPIYYWIFSGLAATKRILRLKNNIVQLNVYRHFTHTLIFAIIAIVLFRVWSLKSHVFTKCLTNWRDFWFDNAFWHILVALILLVIMFLFRPSNNNQLYAFVPLLDHLDNDNNYEEKMGGLNNINKSGVFESVRIYKTTDIENGSASKSEKQQQTTLNHETKISVSGAGASNDNDVVENALRRVEDNVQTLIFDQAIDSQYKIVNNELERSTME